ncbi:MAG: septum formation initiator family protein [Acidobacteriota bacterium]
MKFSRKARREVFLILLFLATLPLAYLMFFGEGGYVRLAAYQADLQLLKLENNRLREQNRALQEKIGRLKRDPAEVERVARDQYNFALPGDVIITLPESQSSK